MDDQTWLEALEEKLKLTEAYLAESKLEVEKLLRLQSALRHYLNLPQEGSRITALPRK